MRYHFIIHKEKNALWAECAELKWCVTQSKDKTMRSLQKNMEEALNLYLEGLGPDDLPRLPAKKLKKAGILEARAAPRAAFAVLLRHVRKEKGLTRAETAEKLGIKNLKIYKRLENPLKAKPDFSIMEKIKSVFPDFDFNLVFN